MRIIPLLFISLFIKANGFAQVIKVMEPVRFLALGDSYTIGQSVTVDNRWPNQFVAELGRQGYNVEELKIIAQTGWTTASLQNAINQQLPLNGYTLVALLIGVNNQFQGGSIDTYTLQFKELLQQAIFLAGNNPQHVFVLSIPDYAYTPFGNGNPLISAEIDLFNGVNRFITSTYNIRYIDITPISRLGLSSPYLIAGDGLHPSGDMYRLWVEEIVKYIEKEVGYSENPPANEEINVSLGGKISGPARLTISDLTGRIIYSEDFNDARLGQMHSINSMNLTEGIYLLQLISDKSRTTKKILIRH